MEEQPCTIRQFYKLVLEEKFVEAETFLLSNIIEPSYCDNEGDTPLLLICKYDLTNIAHIYIKQYGKKCVPDHINNNGETALLIACAKQNYVLVKLLIFTFRNKCIPNHMDNLNNTAFSVAFDKSFNLSKLLITSFDYNASIRDNNGDTALVEACSKKNSCLAELLLNTYGVNCRIDATNNVGCTALIYACSHSMIAICELLLTRFTNFCNIDCIDNTGDTALIYAVSNSLYKIANMILDRTNNIYNIKRVLTLAEDNKMQPILDRLKVRVTPIKKIYSYDEKDCVICRQSINQRIVLISCGHSCYCESCSLKITSCSICNTHIFDRYFLPSSSGEVMAEVDRQLAASS